MTTAKDNTERNERILALAREGKGKGTVAKELGLGVGEVAGVLRRARESGKLARPAQPTAAEAHAVPEPSEPSADPLQSRWSALTRRNKQRSPQ